MIFRRDRWRKMDSEIRKRIASYFCGWVGQRKHRLIVTAIDRTKLKEIEKDGDSAERRDEWLAAELHVALQIQKANQTSGNNMGTSFLIFDDNKVRADMLSNLICKTPWTNDCYGRQKS